MAASFEPQSGLNASVIIPTFRRLDKLPAALESIKQQTIAARETIIVAADPDERLRAEALASEILGPANFLVVGENFPLLGGAARNLGWKAAVGDIVFFLDDDDYWAPRKIEAHLEEHHKTKSEIVYSGVWYSFNANDNRPSKATPFQGDVCAQLLTGFCPPTTSCVSVSRAALESVDGFDASLPSYQDWELWYRLASTGHKFQSVEEPLTYFVQHDSDRVSTNVVRRQEAGQRVLEKYKNDPRMVEFFSREHRHTLERIIVFNARRGESSATRILMNAMRDRTFSAYEYRPYWIAFKLAVEYARFSITRRSPAINRAS